MKKLFKIGLIIFIGLMTFMAISVGIMLIGQKKGLNEEITTIDVNQLEDGVYVGNYENFRWSNSVEVTIEDGRIIKIKVLKDMVFKSDEVFAQISEDIVLEQSLDVDMNAGGTISSTAYLKAIEDALLKASLRNQ